MHKDVNCWMLLINSLCLQAIRDKKLKLNSSGLEQRDFIPLSEACSIIGSLTVRPLESKMPPIINIGTGVSTSVIQMTRFIQKRFFSRNPNLDVIRKQLDWSNFQIFHFMR